MARVGAFTMLFLILALPLLAEAPPAQATRLLPSAPHDGISVQLIESAQALGYEETAEIFDVNEAEPVRVLKAQNGDETLLLFHVMSSGEDVFASIRGSGEQTEMRVWGSGPDEAIFSATGIRIQPRSDATTPLTTLTPAANGVVENLACLGRALGVDFSSLTTSGISALISRASCSSANGLALILTAGSCLSIPHPIATATCITGFAQVIACGYANCATCTVSTINRGNTVSGTFAAGCRATHRNTYAKFYKFTLTQTTTVTIDLMSSTVDPFVFLLQGGTTGSPVITFDDDSGAGFNSRIVRTLGPGTYTIEATTYYSAATGSFTLSLR